MGKKKLKLGSRVREVEMRQGPTPEQRRGMVVEEVEGIRDMVREAEERLRSQLITLPADARAQVEAYLLPDLTMMLSHDHGYCARAGYTFEQLIDAVRSDQEEED